MLIEKLFITDIKNIDWDKHYVLRSQSFVKQQFGTFVKSVSDQLLD